MKKDKSLFNIIAMGLIMFFHLSIPKCLDILFPFYGFYSDLYYLYYVLLDTVTIILAYLLFKQVNNEELYQNKLLTLENIRILCISLLGIYSVEYFLIKHLTNSTANSQAINDFLYYSTGKYYSYLFLLLICLLGPIVEELIYRGLLMNALFRKSTYGIDIFISACLFSMIHIYKYPWSTIAFFIYFVYGLGFAMIYHYSRNLKLSMVAHVAVNTFISIPYIIYVFTN